MILLLPSTHSRQYIGSLGVTLLVLVCTEPDWGEGQQRGWGRGRGIMAECEKDDLRQVQPEDQCGRRSLAHPRVLLARHEHQEPGTVTCMQAHTLSGYSLKTTPSGHNGTDLEVKYHGMF